MRRFTTALLPALVVLALGACDDNGSGLGEGRLSIKLTDAPAADLKEAFIQVDKFILIGTPNDTSASGRIEIEPDVDDFINLLTLTGGKVLEIVNDADVPEGTYSELRLVLGDAYVKLKDGRVFATSGADLPDGVTSSGELKCPSCAQSGFKVKFSGSGFSVADNSTVVLDFDAAQSFGHEAGNSGKFLMHPVLRATAETIQLGRIRGNVSLAASVTIPTCGTVANNLSVFKPVAIMGADTLTGVTDSTGYFKVTGAVPGTYTLTSVKDYTYANGDSLTITAAPSAATVVVPAGDSVTANYSITATSCH
jgi:hypothetical protein